MIVEQYKAEIVEAPTINNGYRTLARTDDGVVYDLTGFCIGFPIGVKGTLHIDVRDTFYTSYIFIPFKDESDAPK